MGDPGSRPGARTGTDRARLWPRGTAVLRREESLQALRRDFVYGGCGVHTGARLLQRRLTDIRTEDLDPGRGEVSEVFQEGHGDGVHLLAARTSRHPDSDRPSTRQAFAHDW